MWGGTKDLFARTAEMYISIHPPRVGRDKSAMLSPVFNVNFNPPSPCGEGRGYTCDFTNVKVISIHPPRVGRDWLYFRYGRFGNISIHPPRVGRDIPAGAELFVSKLFQSTLPVWGGTGSVVADATIHLNLNPPSPCGEGRF